MSTSHSFSLLFLIIRIWRKEKHLKNCPVHIFSTHFYSAMRDKGPDKVSSWTAKKNIDVFRKKFILIPVHKGIHWFLICVVNPGAILNKLKNTSTEKPGDDELYPGILFFDSLINEDLINEDEKTQIADNLRKWLNSEWTRLEKWSNDDERAPFKTYVMNVHEPKSE
jgi:Ulp1 family protease